MLNKNSENMSELKDARLLGGIGAILTTFGLFIPFLSFAAYIAGVVLKVIAVNKISSSLNDKEIFNNYLISLLAPIVGTFSIVVLGFMLGLRYISLLRTLTGYELRRVIIERMGTTFRFVLILLVIIWIVLIISAIFLKKSFDTIANKLNVSLFSTTALVYLIGSILTIIAIGLVVIFVAKVLEIVAFFSIQEQPLTQSIPKTSV